MQFWESVSSLQEGWRINFVLLVLILQVNLEGGVQVHRYSP